MSKAVILIGMVGCLFVLSTTGCGTLNSSQAASRPELAEPDETRLAEALAQYSMAVREGLSGDEEEVVNRYRAAIEADPGNSSLRMELAVILLHAGRFQDMDAVVDGIIADFPDAPRAYRVKSFGLRLRGKLDEALPPLRKAIELEPDNLSHYLETATIQNRLELFDEAEATLENALDAVTNRVDALHALAELYTQNAARNKNDDLPLDPEPLRFISQALEEFPEDTTLLSLYGDLLILHLRIEDAIEVFGKIEALNPDDDVIRQKLARSLASVGDPERAIELLEQVIVKQPANFRLRVYLAELYQRQENADKAIENYQAAINARPELPGVYLQLTYLLLGEKRVDEAVGLLNVARERISSDHRLVELQAYIHFTAEQYEQAAALSALAEEMVAEKEARHFLGSFPVTAAIANQMTTNYTEAARLLRDNAAVAPGVLNEYVGFALRGEPDSDRLNGAFEVLALIEDIIPVDAGTQTLLGLLGLRAERYDFALTHLIKAEEAAIEAGDEEDLDERFYFWLGSASERVKEFEQAEEYFIVAISKQPDFAEAHNYLAYMNTERGVKLEEAYDHVGVALAVEPDNGAFIDTRGWIYYMQGKYEEALVDIERAAELVPDDPTITDHLGDIHLALGNEEEAIKWWKVSYTLDASNEKVAEKLTTRGINLEEIPAAPETEPTPEL